MSDAIVIQGVTKTFGQKVAVDDLDLVVPAGSVCGFIGPNGAGKSTAIRMIMSIMFPDRGRISVLGRPSALESKDRIGYLPEERGIYRKMRVGAFLTYMGRLKGVPHRVLRGRTRDWLARVDLGDCIRRRCEELSKGMQQKVQFLAAIIHEPELVILDEPFSGLDPVNRRLLRDLIDEQHRAGRTIIFSTHAMHEAEQLCDQIFMINRGRKVLDASLDQIHARFHPSLLVVEPAGQPPVHPDGQAALRAIAGVLSIDRTRAGFEIRLDERADPPLVIAEIARAIPCRRIELKRISLEDVFLDLVGASGLPAPAREELRADDAAEAAEVANA